MKAGRRGLIFLHGLAILGGAATAILVGESSVLPTGSVGASAESETPEENLLEIARSAEPPEFAAVLARLDPRENPDRAFDAVEAGRALCRRWSVDDPRGLLAFLSEEGNRAFREPAIHAWVLRDPRGAISAIREIKDPDPRKQLMSAALGALARIDPAEFLEIHDLIPAEFESREFYHALALQELARRDPDTAVPLLESLKTDYHRTQFIRNLIETWTRREPEKALAWAESLDSPASRQQALKIILVETAKNDLDRAAALVEKHRVGSGSRWDAGQIPEGGDSRRRRLAIGEFLAGAVESDPEFALEWATENYDATVGTALQQATFSSSGHSGKLLELNRELMARGLSGPLASTGSFGGAKLDWPPRTEDAVRQWAKGGFHAGSKTSPRTWKVEEIREATALLVENPDLARTGDWHRTLSERWARENPRAAMEWSATLPPKLQIEAAESALESWYRLEPDRAVAFTESLPESEFRGYAIEKIASEWVRADPDAVIAWTAALPGGSDRHAAAARIARHLRYRDPRQAIEVSGLIEDGDLRLDSLGAIVDVWARFRREEAAAFIREAELSERERRSLLERIARR